MDKVLFAGSAPFSVPLLEWLIQKNLVAAVLTAPDRAAGRGMKMTPTAVKLVAESHGLPVLQPEFLRGQWLAEIASLVSDQNCDVLVCAAYGKIFGPKFLAMFSRGTVNVHPSLLPRFRGAAPIPATLLAGDAETGVSLQKISLKMDCGDILLQSHYKIDESDTTSTLLEKLAQQSVELMEILSNDYDGIYANARAQDEQQAVYCQKIGHKMGHVQWCESAEQIVRMTRALSPPYSGVKLEYDGAILKVWHATVYDSNAQSAEHGTIVGIDEQEGILLQCKRGIIAIKMLQTAGKRKMHWKEFLQGHRGILDAKFS